MMFSPSCISIVLFKVEATFLHLTPVTMFDGRIIKLIFDALTARYGMIDEAFMITFSLSNHTVKSVYSQRNTSWHVQDNPSYSL